ncbi:hypothetical protein T492DRAFT_326446 [Pavlovales sp. CCMP2436]|nr:hypothetical protein T492DRAFT_326446 [Pavlovales sp. CCMP2436]
MSYHYVVTAHKPTNVTHAVVGNFTAPNDVNLIVCKSTRLELHTLIDERLQQVLDVPIFGRVATLQLWKPAGEKCELLFLTTERYQFCVLAFDPSTHELVTRANGDLHDRVGRPVEFGQIAIIDASCRLIGLRLYDGLLKLIPVGPAASGSASATGSRVISLGLYICEFIGFI